MTYKPTTLLKGCLWHLPPEEIGRSWTVRTLMILEAQWLCSYYSPPNLGGAGVVILRTGYQVDTKNVNGSGVEG